VLSQKLMQLGADGIRVRCKRVEKRRKAGSGYGFSEPDGELQMLILDDVGVCLGVRSIT
jgi:hypothetical protein